MKHSNPLPRHDPIFGGKLRMHTHGKQAMLGDRGPFCKCMDCARERNDRLEREHAKVVADLCADLPPAIIGDSNAQKVVAQIYKRVEEILTEYDEAESIWGERVLKTIEEYVRRPA